MLNHIIAIVIYLYTHILLCDFLMADNELIINSKLKRVELNIRINNLGADALRAALGLIEDTHDLEQAVAAGEKYQELKPDTGTATKTQRGK